MLIVNPSATIEGEIDGEEMLKRIERFGRVCYKSEDRITEDSAERFVKMLIQSGHESVLEHEKVTVRLVCDRGVSHEAVRHRLASFSQESTRYCDYLGGVAFVKPCFFTGRRFEIWLQAMNSAEYYYNALRKEGAAPQEARSVLPNSLKTEIVVTANLREWRLIFKQRTAKAAHVQMREVMVPLLLTFQDRIPVVFDDIVPHIEAKSA